MTQYRRDSWWHAAFEFIVGFLCGWFFCSWRRSHVDYREWQNMQKDIPEPARKPAQFGNWSTTPLAKQPKGTHGRL